MLTTAKAWELRDGDHIVHAGGNWTLVDDPKPGPPGWTSLRCRDRAGLLVIHMIEGTDDVNVVRVKDTTSQRESARRKDATWQSRRVRGSSR